MTEAEIIDAVKRGELSQGEAARRLGRSRKYVRYRVDPDFAERERAAHREHNMTPDQIKRKRERLLVRNMARDQLERRRARAREYMRAYRRRRKPPRDT